MRVLLFPLASPCPVCAAPADPDPSRPATPPNVGDLTICRACGDVLQFTATGGLVSMPSDVWWALAEADRDELRRLQSRMRVAPPRERHV